MSQTPRTVTVSVPTSQLADDLVPLLDGVDLVVWSLSGPPPRDAFDIVVPPYMSMARSLEALTGVEVGLVQGQSIGFDGVDEHLPAGMRFANASSVHEASTAELALALVLASQRDLPRYVRAQDRHEWASAPSPSLADRRVLVLGYGGVGKAVAARLAPFETEVTIVASRPRAVGRRRGDGGGREDAPPWKAQPT